MLNVGIIRWKGTVAPGQISHKIVATYDIFVTAIALAGGEPPSDRAYDGIDLSPTLVGTEDALTPDLFRTALR